MAADPLSRQSKVTERQISRAAHELASQERYNPTWCKPGAGVSQTSDAALYRRRAHLILAAAIDGTAERI